MPSAEQTARINAAVDLTTSLVAIWFDSDDLQQRRHVAIIADGVVFADLQAAQYVASRRALAPIVEEAPRPRDGGCTNPHGVRSEVATRLVKAVRAGMLDTAEQEHWRTICAALDVLWPSSSLQARAICRDLLPKRRA